MKKVKITYDVAKRARTLTERGLDFEDAIKIFESPHLQIEDDRFDYKEPRYKVFGELDGRRVVFIWTPRDGTHRIIMMRHAHEEEFKDRGRTLD